MPLERLDVYLVVVIVTMKKGFLAEYLHSSTS